MGSQYSNIIPFTQFHITTLNYASLQLNNLGLSLAVEDQTLVVQFSFYL